MFTRSKTHQHKFQKDQASRANVIATHQTSDILQIRENLHKLIDTIIDNVLNKSDKNNQNDLIVQLRNLIKNLERLKDPKIVYRKQYYILQIKIIRVLN